jgi:RimJ/RimL family protein N-acetyltransferase
VDTKEPVIVTERLELHHISSDRLINLFENRDDAVALADEKFTNPLRVLIDFQGPLAWRVPQVKENSSVNKWFVRWIVLKDSQEIIGSTSFHGAPDADGMMEIGLGIESAHQNKGYAKESLLGMWRWVLTFPEVKTLRYTVSPENLPSIAVIKYFGFKFMGQQMDEIDGPEDIYEMDRESFLQRWGGNNER